MLYFIHTPFRSCLIVFSFPSQASFKISVKPNALRPFLMISFPFSDLRCRYMSFITFT